MRSPNWFLKILIPFTIAVLTPKEISLALATDSARNAPSEGAYFTGRYQNFFTQMLGKSDSETTRRIESIFTQLFYGDDKTQRVYYPVDSDMAYIEDVQFNDVRTEGMSYGMMIAVQMNKKAEFDRLWKWAKVHMQHQSGPRKKYFAWHCETNGTMIDSGSASDGEEWFAMTLFFASGRWGNGNGIFDYRAEAQKILDAMIHKADEPGNPGTVTSMFSQKERMVVFVPSVDGATFTDPSYHLPGYYELWARWSDKENQFWCGVATESRKFLKKALNPVTGLSPDYAQFDGRPLNRWGGGTNDFRYDSWRVGLNVAVDYLWFAKDPWEVMQSNRLLNFFYSQGVKTYGGLYTVDGKLFPSDHSTGLVAMNAAACTASTNANRKEFVEDLWNTPTPTGIYRYYDGLLYMLGMLQVSGNFRIYDPTGKVVQACPD